MYKAYNRDQAMSIATALINSEMVGENEEMSKNYDGMPVYVFEDGSYIVDSTERYNHLHVVGRDGLDTRFEDDIYIESDGKPETYADLQSQIMYIRTYDSGCSHDRPILTPDNISKLMIKTLIYGAINAMFARYDDAANVAEYQAMRYFDGFEGGHVNCYDTIYNPIKYNPFVR